MCANGIIKTDQRGTSLGKEGIPNLQFFQFLAVDDDLLLNFCINMEEIFNF